MGEDSRCFSCHYYTKTPPLGDAMWATSFANDVVGAEGLEPPTLSV